MDKIFTSKATTLKILKNKLRKSKVEKLYNFTVIEWTTEPNKILERISSTFTSNQIIIRSSALDEDSWESSQAGYYESILNVNTRSKKLISQAINSVINQTYKNWQLYIIDDGSSDNSMQIINKFINLKKVKIIKLHKNKGPAFCRNYGMRISKAKYISFIDSDDIWFDQKLENQIDFMESNNFNFTYTDYVPFFQNNGEKKFKNRTFIKDFFNYEMFTKNSSINTTTMIINRSILVNHRLYNQ